MGTIEDNFKDEVPKQLAWTYVPHNFSSPILFERAKECRRIEFHFEQQGGLVSCFLRSAGGAAELCNLTECRRK
jgi:hypothetical protein